MNTHPTDPPDIAVGRDEGDTVSLTVDGATVSLSVADAVGVAGLLLMSAVEAGSHAGEDRDATVDLVTEAATTALAAYPAADHFAALTRTWSLLGLEQARAAEEYATVALDRQDGEYTFIGDVTLTDLATALDDPEDITRDFLTERRAVHQQVTALQARPT